MDNEDFDLDTLTDFIDEEALKIQEGFLKKSAEKRPRDSFCWGAEALRMLCIRLAIAEHCMMQRLSPERYREMQIQFDTDY